MKIPLAAIAFISMGSACFANEPLAQSKDGQVIVENLPSAVEREFEGCGCHFYSPGSSSKMAIAWDYSQRESMTAAIQVNGQTERLPLVDETSKRKRGPNREPRKGDITRYKFSSGSVSSILSCKVSETCWGTSGCEYIGYSCSAQVEVGNVRVKLPLEGGCGC